MRGLIRIVVVLAVLWTAWWFAAAYAIREGIARNTDVQAASVEVTGFPLALVTQISGMQLLDPARDVQVTADAVRLEAPAWWPGDATLFVPDDGVQITIGGRVLRLSAQAAAASLALHPGIALELERLGVTSGDWALTDAAETILGGGALDIGLVQNADAPTQYEFNARADGLRLGSDVRGRLGVPVGWPGSMSALEAGGSLQFADPLAQRHVQGPAPHLNAIQLTQALAIWGDVEISGAGTVVFDAAGVPEGELSVLVRNWRVLYRMADGLVPQQTEIMLNALANIGGNPDTLDLTLRFAGGNAFLGPIPLGPVPPLVPR